MNVQVEAYGLELKDNTITKALIDGEWGVRYVFGSADHKNRYEACLTVEESENLIARIQSSLSSIRQVKAAQRNQNVN